MTIFTQWERFNLLRGLKLLLMSKLQDMLVAETDLNTKGVGQNCPLPHGHSSRGKILSPCPLTIIATSTKGAKQ